MSTLRRIVIWLSLLLCLGSFTLTGCHTVEGAGEDIESAGRSLQRAAD